MAKICVLVTLSLYRAQYFHRRTRCHSDGPGGVTRRYGRSSSRHLGRPGRAGVVQWMPDQPAWIWTPLWNDTDWNGWEMSMILDWPVVFYFDRGMPNQQNVFFNLADETLSNREVNQWVESHWADVAGMAPLCYSARSNEKPLKPNWRWTGCFQRVSLTEK